MNNEFDKTKRCAMNKKWLVLSSFLLMVFTQSAAGSCILKKREDVFGQDYISGRVSQELAGQLKKKQTACAACAPWHGALRSAW